MSEFLDELARALAEPMPRRQAVRIAAAAAVAVAFPGWRPRPAAAGVLETCTKARPWKCKCPSKNGLFFDLCCPPDYQCKCESDASVCIPCKGTLCKPIHRPGYPAPKGHSVCCPRGATCTRNYEKAACCGPDQNVVKGGGACVCPKNTTVCGTINCCKNNEESCIDNECCPTARSIGGACCPEASATTGTGGAKYCCPPNTVPTGTNEAGVNGCCPEEIPNCCDNALLPLQPRPGYSYICVSGGLTIFQPQP